MNNSLPQLLRSGPLERIVSTLIAVFGDLGHNGIMARAWRGKGESFLVLTRPENHRYRPFAGNLGGNVDVAVVNMEGHL